MEYSRALDSVVAEWKKDPIVDEFAFETFRSNVVNALSPEESYASIPITVEVLLAESDAGTLIELLETLISLARRSDTTEAAEFVRMTVRRLEAAVENIAEKGLREYAASKLDELLRFYRIGR